jgi:hypothetical protein
MERKDERENYREKPKKKEEYVKGADKDIWGVALLVPSPPLISSHSVMLH